jgi:peptidoglycan hydrolase-like protein with peptidoglycan-binding domain
MLFSSIRIRSLVLWAILAGIILAPQATALAEKAPTPIEAAAETRVQVNVRDAAGAPLEGARISIAGLGLAGVTDGRGQWSSAALPVSAASTTIEVAVTARGQRPWTIRGATVYSGTTLSIEAALAPAGGNSAPEVVDVAPAPAQGPVASPVDAAPAPAATALTIPTSIRVYRVQLGRVDTVDFKYYVKHVLPSEWLPSWNTNSLRAGAVAAKTFAWYQLLNPKYPGKGYDVRDDTSDQVYNPSISYTSTNDAVDFTWTTTLTRNGAIFESQFCAGASNASKTAGQCNELYGSNFPLGNYMSQYGSQYMASNLGYVWQQILTFYYDNVVVGNASGWPVLREGDWNKRVAAAEYLLRQRGYTVVADGQFDSQTTSAAKSFQAAVGLAADGVIGEATFTRLVVTARLNDNNNAVRAIQVLLDIQNTGLFGSTTDSVVRQFQQAQGLTVDGIVGAQTWRAAFSKPLN